MSWQGTHFSTLPSSSPSSPDHHTLAGQGLHFSNAWVTIMQLIKDFAPKTWRHNDSTSPQQAAIFHTLLLTPQLNGCISGDVTGSVGHPYVTSCLTLDSIGSLSVWERMLAADIGGAARCSIRKMVSAGRGTSVGASANV